MADGGTARDWANFIGFLRGLSHRETLIQGVQNY